MLKIAAVAIAAALTACASPYEKFYQPRAIGQASGFAPVTDEPRLITGGDSKRAVLDMYEEGYGLIGVSDFVGPAGKTDGALKQAKKVGAAIVVVMSKYQSTASGAMPLTLPTTTTPPRRASFSRNCSDGTIARPPRSPFPRCLTASSADCLRGRLGRRRFSSTVIRCCPITSRS